MNPVALFVRHRAKPGQRSKVIEVWERFVRPRAEANPDHLHYFMCVDTADPDAIHVFQLYTSADAAKALLAQPWYPQYLREVAPFIAQPPEIREASLLWRK